VTAFSLRCRRVLTQALALLTAALALVACSPDPASPAPTGPVAASSGTRLDQARSTVDALVHAARTNDPAGFVALTSDRDPSFGDRSRLLFDNLSTLPLAELQIRLDPQQQPLTQAREQLLGTQAWVQRATITWRLTDDDADADHQVWLTFLPERGTVELAGTGDGPTATPPPTAPPAQPLWWLEPTTATEHGGITVLVGSGADAAQWTADAVDAATRVRQRLPPELEQRWDGRAVVEIPAAGRDFEAVLGQPAGSYASIAAVTQPEGSAANSALRVVVNPRAAGLAIADRRDTLTHELVHRATDAPASAAPTWAEEGLAEWVALRGESGRRSAGTAGLLKRVRDSGAPAALPSDQDFTVGSPELARGYAAGWLACRYVAAEYSPRALGRLYLRLSQGRTLDQASREALGVSAVRFTSDWRRYLLRLAGAG
jgi:hypothetical protein